MASVDAAIQSDKMTSSASSQRQRTHTRFEIALTNARPNGRRYLILETISKVLRQLKDGRLKVELGTHERILITPNQLASFINGQAAYEKFLNGAVEDENPRSSIRAYDSDRTDSSLTSDFSSPEVKLKQEKSETRLAWPTVSQGRLSQHGEAETESGQSSDGESDDVPLRGWLASHAKKRVMASSLTTDSDNQSESSSEESDEVPLKTWLSNHGRKRKRRTSSIGSSLSRSSSNSSVPLNLRTSSASLVDHDTDNSKPASSTSRSNTPAETSKVHKKQTGKYRTPFVNPSSPFAMCHMQHCDTCKLGPGGERGDLVYCQGCSYSFHLECCKSHAKHHLIRQTEHFWVLQCRYCMGANEDINSQSCFVCGERGLNTEKFVAYVPRPSTAPARVSNVGAALQTTSAMTPDPLTETDSKKSSPDPDEQVTDARMFNAERVMFRCERCHRGAHYEHLPRLDDRNIVEQYSNRVCPLCEKHPRKVDTILAWRPLEKPTESTEISLTTVPPYKREYLVKFENESYFHTFWVDGSWLISTASNAVVRAFHKRHYTPIYSETEAIPEDYYRIESIFRVRYKGGKSRDSMRFESEREELDSLDEVEEVFAKWKGLSFTELFWEVPPKQTEKERYEDYLLAFKDYVRGFYIHVPGKDVSLRIRDARRSEFSTLEFKEQPGFIKGGKLMDYQLNGLNWMYYKWYKGQPAILADEMGLGKTIQIISFLSVLFHRHGVWPLLVVAPQSTVPNWVREFQKWAPDLRTVAFSGLKSYREIQLKYMLSLNPKSRRDLSCHVIVTSYNAVSDGFAFLNQFQWQVLVVDEAQRLKSESSQLSRSLKELSTLHKVLLTGTPLQNNIRELFNILEFLNPQNIDAAALESEYSEMTEENIGKLHSLIRPYFLRRTKDEVLVGLIPKKVEVIVPVTMTSLQKRLYKSILEKNPALLRTIVSTTKIANKSVKSNLTNILVQLRKTLCHPYVYNIDIEQRTTSPEETLRRLIEASGKLELLHLMLPKLISEGHKVLIFTQFLGMLDIFEDFFSLMGVKYVRIDGSVTSQARQQRIDAFNAENSDISLFILSTRAGGVGINLDTVIVYDADYNPHQDVQALSRAHRLGQKNKVLVFSLVTRNSIEEKILEIGRRKMALDQVVIEKMKVADENEEGLSDIQSILQTGARALFEDTDDTDIKYDSASVDKLLDRTQGDDVPESELKEASKFGFARVWENEKGVLTEFHETEAEKVAEDPGFWDKIMEQREAELQQENLKKLAAFGRGRRARTYVAKPVDNVAEDEYETSVPKKGRRKSRASSTDLFHASESGSDDDDYRVGEVPEDLEVLEVPDNVSKAPVPIESSQNLVPTTKVQVPIANAQAPLNKPRYPWMVADPKALYQSPSPMESRKVGNLEKPSQPPPQMVASGSQALPSPIQLPRTLPGLVPALPSRVHEPPKGITTGEHSWSPSPFASQSRNGQPSSATSLTTGLPNARLESLATRTDTPSRIPPFRIQPVLRAAQIECDGSHSNHEPGKCPIRTITPVRCPLCHYPHLPGAGACAVLRSQQSLEKILVAISQSKESEEMKRVATTTVRAVLLSKKATDAMPNA